MRVTQSLKNSLKSTVKRSHTGLEVIFKRPCHLKVVLKSSCHKSGLESLKSGHTVVKSGLKQHKNAVPKSSVLKGTEDVPCHLLFRIY